MHSHVCSTNYTQWVTGKSHGTQKEEEKELLGRNKSSRERWRGMKEGENDYNLLNTSVKESKANKDLR